MLHIIFFILKCIGWFLLAILGLVLLLTCIVLFVPFRYQVQGECTGKLNTLCGKIRFSWLLHLLDGTVAYQDGEADWNIRIAWKRITSDLEAQSIEEDEAPGRDTGSDKEESNAANVIEASEKIPEPKKLETKAQSLKEKKTASKETRTQKEKTVDTALKIKKEKKESRISKIFEKIKYTFKKICGTISSLKEKKDKIMTFLTDEVHQSAFRAALKEVKKLLLRLRPKRLEGRVHYGFEDPSLTGYVLAAASMVYPLFGEQAEIHPDFENKVLEGEVNVTGKIRTIYAVMMGWNLIWNKNVRTTFKHIRKIKL